MIRLLIFWIKEYVFEFYLYFFIAYVLVIYLKKLLILIFIPISNMEKRYTNFGQNMS